MTAPVTGLAWYVDLRGPDGNAYVIMGTVSRLIRQTFPGAKGVAMAKEYTTAAMSGDYEMLLGVTRHYVDLRELGPMIVRADAPEVEPDELDAIIQGGDDA